MGKTYYVWTMGCQMNEADSRRLGAQLEGLGCRAAGSADSADIVVLNTCVVRQQAEDKALSRLGRLRAVKRRRPEMVIGLMGCLVGRRVTPGLRRRFPFVDVFMSPSDPAPLIEFLAGPGGGDGGGCGVYRLPAAGRGRTVLAQVPVVLGCSHACSFCVIPYRRGPERSVPRREVLAEVRALARQGVREVMLLGQIIDRYGMDLDGEGDLADLLREVAEVEGILRIRFLTSHPGWMSDRLLDAVAGTAKVCPHIEVPIQSGNDEVLARMRRGYTVDAYRRLIERIRARVPGAAIHSDIIVGFPGETEAQFEDTCRLAREIRFDKLHLAPYSERPGTVAARRFADDVAAEEKDRRHRFLDDIQAGILRARNAALAGTTVEVLVEGRQRGRWRGRTPEDRLVFFAHPDDLRGCLVDVRIDDPGPFFQMGSLQRVKVPAP